MEGDPREVLLVDADDCTSGLAALQQQASDIVIEAGSQWGEAGRLQVCEVHLR